MTPLHYYIEDFEDGTLTASNDGPRTDRKPIMVVPALTTRSGNTQDDQQTGQPVAAPLSHGSNPNSNAAGRRREDDENLVPELASTLLKPSHGAAWRGNASDNLVGGQAVRRLTPVECCRLQGFPDNWLGGNEPPDSPKYAALGDAVTVPVAEWIGRRIA